MDRRTFNKLAAVSSVAGLVATQGMAQASANQTNPEQGWKSGQDSPIHDSDRLMPLSERRVVLENDFYKLEFDERTGSMTGWLAKKTGWQMVKNPKFAESFHVFAPTPDRAYNPAIGARNFAASVTRSTDGKSLTIVWKQLVSEYSGILDITLTAVTTLEAQNVHFNLTVKNDSRQQVASVEWPIMGGWTKLPDEPSMHRGTYNNGYSGIEGGGFWPRFGNELNGCGVSFPMQDWDGHFSLLAGEKAGLYVSAHDLARATYVRWTMELKPGWLDSRASSLPRETEVSDHPIRLVYSTVNYPFAAPGETIQCRDVVMSVYQGDWHTGADIFKRWQQTWYKAPSKPDWTKSPHSWAQIQINSSEDDLRTAYKDLPRRALQCAKARITALQITGWNHLGQDRNNPSHDTDPRLGTHEEFKEAIARIEKMGVRVILFNKYTWADTSTQWYRDELHNYMVSDPNGCPYIHHGYKYQTPVQLANINTRRLASACYLSKQWQDLSRKEFQKVLDLGASGMLYDEAASTGDAHACFDPKHGHRVGAALQPGSFKLAEMFRSMAREQKGEGKFLFAGEAIYEGLSLYYSLSYFRIHEGHQPLGRYLNPGLDMMIAITGFDDREMINCALQFRYVMSFEPHIFKGNMNDYPLTLAYGMKVNAFREKHREWVWDAEFRDNLDATVQFTGPGHGAYSVFKATNGKYAAVLLNHSTKALSAKVSFANGGGAQAWASPEDPALKPVSGELKIAPRGAVLLVQS